MNDLIEVIAKDIIESESSQEATTKMAFYQTILKPEVMDKTAAIVLEEMEKSADEDTRSFAEKHPVGTAAALLAAGAGAGYGGYKTGKRFIESLGEKRMGKLQHEGEYLGNKMQRNINQSDTIEKKLKDRPDDAALSEYLKGLKDESGPIRKAVRDNVNKQQSNEKLTKRLRTPVGIAAGVLGADVATGAVGMAATHKKREG